MQIKILHLLRIFMFCFPIALSAQSDVLEEYVRYGLDQNHAVRQLQLQYEKSQFVVKEAKGLYSPTLNLQGNYVLAEGGRTIAFPIGDILNPVFQNLDLINAALNPQAPNYPQLENVAEQLNPNNFYDARLRLALPIVNAEIWYNKKIREQQSTIAKTDLEIYEKQLTLEIKTAYFNYLKATQAIRIYENALLLLKESERVNRRLVEAGSQVKYQISRSISEISKIEAELESATNMQKNAKAYFNFLLDKPADESIVIDPRFAEYTLTLPIAVPEGDGGNREELKKLSQVSLINRFVLHLNKSSWIPKMGAQFDLGTQGFNFEFDDQSRYYLLGLNIDWALFNGLRDVNKVQQAKLDISVLDEQTLYVKSQLQLAAITSANTYLSALKKYGATTEQLAAARDYFDYTDKRYRGGEGLYIEFLDARNQLTQSQLQQSIQYYDAWIAYAMAERATGN